MKKAIRVDLDAAFVLHQRRFRETSLLLEVFTEIYGRQAMIARGARRPGSRWHGLLTPFTPVLVSWTRRGELGTVTEVERRPGNGNLHGREVLSGFYLNELLMRMMARDDPHPELFLAYAEALADLSRLDEIEPVLRVFEKRLLESVGYGLILDHCVSDGAAIEPDRQYRYRAEHGPADGAGTSGVAVSGATLMALAAESLTTAAHLSEAKRLMRHILDRHLDGKPLFSRRLFRPARRSAAANTI